VNKITYNRGYVRDDGMVFWAYQSKTSRGGSERWVTSEKFKSSIKAEKARVAKITLPKKVIKRGSVRGDGKVFWAYAKGCKDGEHWITKEKFDQRMESNRGRDRKRCKLEHRKKDCRKRAKKKRAENPEKKRAEDREYRNRSEVRKMTNKTARRYTRKKRKNDPVFLMKCRMYCRVNGVFKSKGFKKNTKTEKMLGCSFVKFKKHIECLFADGMSWENKNEWHIDHIIPLYCATTIEGLEKLFHYKNCRPSWAPDNMSKGNRLELES